MKSLFTLFFIAVSGLLFANSIAGKIIDQESRYGIEYGKVKLTSDDTTLVTYTDDEGNYGFYNLKPDVYNLTASSLGYRSKTEFEIKVTLAKPRLINIALEEDLIELDSVVIGGSDYAFNVNEETPVSLYSIGSEDIERNPGAGRDVSRVIQSLPGVATTPSFRNDIIIRGGAPNENRFYLDGVEVPNINHFATQGSSGGPVGLINVNLVDNVDFYSSAFPAERGNALSSVISFDLKDGRKDTLGLRATVGASDFGLTAEGPIGKNVSYIASIRRSYLQFLFKAIGLPFLPTYNDYQYKVKITPNDKSEITILGLGALDQFELNESVNDGITDSETLRRNKFILGNLPINEQWNYTQGIKYVRFGEKSSKTFVLSRNMLNNSAFKFENNDESKRKTTDYKSQEIENKFRYEHLIYGKYFDLTYSGNLEYAKFNTKSSFFRNVNGSPLEINYDSDLKLLKYGASAQLRKSILSDKLKLGLGVRLDANSYSVNMSNPLEQLSPRFSVSYQITKQFNLNGNVGTYYQLPAYTVLGYKNNAGELENKNNNLTYIKNTHAVLGAKWFTKYNAQLSLEGFYKNYENYPFLINDSLSLANLGSDFGVIGNDAVTSSSKGRSYGAEFLYQQKLTKGFFGILALTFVKSEFTDKNGDFKPSAWDSRSIANLTFGKKFKKNWQIGAKFRYSGGLPYTPFDIETSSKVQNWNIFGQGTLDYSQLNSLRTGPNHGLDLRVDKEYFFKKVSLNFYIDVENVYGFSPDLAPTLLLQENENGNNIIENPNAPFTEQTYATELLNTGTGTILPTIGVIIDF